MNNSQMNGMNLNFPQNKLTNETIMNSNIPITSASSQFDKYKREVDRGMPVLYDGNKLPEKGQIIYSTDYDARYNPNRIRHKKKVYFSSFNKNNSNQTTSEFSVNAFVSNTKGIVSINPIKVNVVYTAPATSIYNGFVEFVDFNSHDYILGNTGKYHASFPVTTGAEGNTVSFSYTFTSDYISQLKTPGNLQNELRVKVYKETSTGTIELFTDIDSFSMEVEFEYEDHPFTL